MDSSFALYLGRHTLETALMLAAPILVTCMLVGVTVTLLCPGPVRTEFLTSAGMDERTFADAFPKFLWIPSRTVARIGVDALDADEAMVITGLPNQVSTRLVQFMPRRLLLPLLKSRHPGLRRDRG